MIDPDADFIKVQGLANDEWSELGQSLEGLWTAMSDLRGHLSTKRSLTESIADRESELVSEERSKHSDMGVGRFEEHLRALKRKDARLQDLREGLTQCQSVVDQTEHRIEFLKVSIRAKGARLEELSNVIQYLASLKASTPKKP